MTPCCPSPLNFKLSILCSLALALFTASSAVGQLSHSGKLFIHGGGSLESTIGSFLELAGGKDAKLVVIPTAAANDNLPSLKDLKGRWRKRGFGDVTLLHTRDRKVADSAKFVEPLKFATAVFISGGAQQRLANAYVGTKTETALDELLRRGGIIGGTSAGAAVMTRAMIGHGKNQPFINTGLNLLPFGIVDQHFRSRSRINRLSAAVQNLPQRTGIGIDERTCIVVSKEKASVFGEGQVTLIRNVDGRTVTNTLSKGDSIELAAFGLTAARKPVLSNMNLPGIAELEARDRALIKLVPQSVDAALQLRSSLTEETGLQEPALESLASCLERLSAGFANEYRAWQQDNSDAPAIFDFSGVDFEAAIRGSKDCPTASGAYGAFTGKWYGRWADRDVDHHWSRVVRPGELAFATTHPRFQVGWQYAWIGDGYGINHCLSFQEQGTIKRFLLGYTEHLEAGDFDRVVARRPHVGISAGEGKLIWITAKEVFFEESHLSAERKASYSIVGFRYSSNAAGELKVQSGFVTEYADSPLARKPFREFRASYSVQRNPLQ